MVLFTKIHKNEKRFLLQENAFSINIQKTILLVVILHQLHVSHHYFDLHLQLLQ
jgi:hypothetical protein